MKLTNEAAEIHQLIGQYTMTLIENSIKERQKIIEEHEPIYWERILRTEDDRLCALFVSEWYHFFTDKNDYENFLDGLFDSIDKELKEI